MEAVMESRQKSNVLRLNDHNYVNWKVTMRWVLTKDKTWATVTSPKPEPVTADWANKNETAMRRLMLTSTSGRQETANHSCGEMCAMRYIFGTLRQHITAMQDMASRVRAAGARIDLVEEISALFFSLPASYDNVVSRLESRNENTLTLELVVGKLLDGYTWRVECRTSEGNEEAMFTKPWQQPGQARQDYGKGNTGAECRKRQKDLASSGGKSKEAARKAADNRGGGQGGDYSFVVMERVSIVAVANTSNEWLVDSGCTSHMTSNRKVFSELKTTKHVVQLADRGQSIPVTGIGTVRLQCNTPDGTEFNANLKDVLYMPELESSLISVSKLLSKESKVVFEDKGCNIERGGKVYLHAKERNGLYELEWLGSAPTKVMPMEATSVQVDISIGEEQPNSRSEITDSLTATPVNGDDSIQQRCGRGRPSKEQGVSHLVPADRTAPEGADEMTQLLLESGTLRIPSHGKKCASCQDACS
ncbi:hypothetical protein CBL_20017 [Carabus blaptoides fortunei]